jgi:hypothetical protein
MLLLPGGVLAVMFFVGEVRGWQGLMVCLFGFTSFDV